MLANELDGLSDGTDGLIKLCMSEMSRRVFQCSDGTAWVGYSLWSEGGSV